MADAISQAERILEKIDEGWPTDGAAKATAQ